MTRSIVILTLNEIAGVRQLIPRLPVSYADELIAVDGGSTDGTLEFLAERNIQVYSQDRRGRGEAFRVGVAHSTGDCIVFFSPDGNEAIEDIPKLFGALEGGADMAIGSRFLPGARNEEDDLSLPLRKWVNQSFTFLANLIWNHGRPYVTDAINGFRGVRRGAFLKFAPQSLGYTIEYEMTLQAMRSGAMIVEIPTREGQRIGGATKGASWPTGVAFLRFFLEAVRGDLSKWLRRVAMARPQVM